ncbi:hypothetical protein ACMFMG_004638 [Clarireedia jacksonii]
MERPAIFTPSGPRLAPLLHPQSAARPPSRSISRSHVLDDLLSDLTPATTLEALTSPSGKLKASIEAASPADRAFGIRATLASKKVEQWLEELSSWSWPAENGSMGFEVPHAKRRKSSSDTSDLHETDGQETVEPQYCGGLLVEEVVRYEQRIDEIGRDMEELDVEEIKREVLDTHFSSRSRPSSSASSIAVPAFLSSYTVLDDFTAIVTATVLQALPNLSKLTRLMDIWSVRLSVLRRVPALLLGMEDAEMALKSGWNAIEISSVSTNEFGETSSSGLTRQTFEIMKNVLQAKVTILGRDLDYMLDTLEGRMDTLPDSWLDRMESIERDYGEWVVAADRKITEGELSTIKTTEKIGAHVRRSTETSRTSIPSIHIESEEESEHAIVDNSTNTRYPRQPEETTLDAADTQNTQHETVADFTAPSVATGILPSEPFRKVVESPTTAGASLLAPGDAEDRGTLDSPATQSPKADVHSTSLVSSILSSPTVGTASAAAAGVAYLAAQGSHESPVNNGAAEEQKLPTQKITDSPGAHSTQIFSIDDITTSHSIEEPSTPVRQQPTNVAHGNLSTPQTTPSTCSTQIREPEATTTPIYKSPSPPPTPSTSVDAQSSQAAILPSPVDLRSIGRSSSLRGIAKTPKFGHAVANALRRSISIEDVSPRKITEASSRTSRVLDWSMANSPTGTSATYQPGNTTTQRTQQAIVNEQHPANGSAQPVRAEAPASSIALVEQLGLASGPSNKANNVDSQTRRTELRLQNAPLAMLSPIKEHHLSKETEPISPTPIRHTPARANDFSFITTNDELLHAPSITSSDGAYESVQRFDSDELDLDVLDHRRILDVHRPSIMVDDTDDDGRRDSIGSNASIIDRRPSVMASGLTLRTADQDSDSGLSATYEDSPLNSRNSQNDSRKYDKTPPGSPPGAPAKFARRPPQLLESPDFSHLGSTNEDAPFLDDVEVTHSIPASPISSSDDQLQQQISSLLQSIPAHIRLRSEPEEKPTQDKLHPRKVRRSVTPSIRTQTSTSSLRAPTPSFTLAPAYAKSGTPRHRSQSGNSEIKVYHLSRSSGEGTIKLFVRLVGENGQRVMVRVGGGWADLGEYLKEYALHHGRRAQADNDKVEVQNLPPRNTSASGPTSGRVTPAPRSASALGYSRPGTAVERPKSSLGFRKVRRKSTMTGSDDRPPIPTAPLPFASPSTPFSTNSTNTHTPPSAASRSSSRMSWNDDENGELGLAGPRGRNKELEERDREWVESMKEKVMMASAEKEKEKERKGPGGHRQSLGEMDKVGGTKRVFRKTSRLEL